jgi:four helix bundle protein
VEFGINREILDKYLSIRKKSRSMAGKRFEDLPVWMRATELVRSIYECSERGRFARDFGLRDQIRRAAVSIVSNIAEGYERDGNRELLQFLSQAKGSCGGSAHKFTLLATKVTSTRTRIGSSFGAASRSAGCWLG